MKRLILAAVISIAATAPSHAATVSYEGDWSVDCHNADQQCWWNVEKSGKKGSYKVTFLSADRMDATTVRCSYGGTAVEAKLKGGKGLQAKLGKGGAPVSFLVTGDGAMKVFPTDGVKDTCGMSGMFGELSPIGY